MLLKEDNNNFLIHIDELSNICGYFNNETPDGYGCNHPDCKEHRLVMIKQDHIDGSFYQNRIDDDSFWFIRNKINKRICQNIEVLRELMSSDKIYNRYFKKLNHSPYSPVFLKTLGLKLQGVCYSFSCPLSFEADKEDFIEFGEDPDCLTEGEWLIIEKDIYNNLLEK
jgi:hypothetical protein